MEHKQNKVYPYEDMYDLPHHVSSSHPHMAIIDRAAQFAAFAALTGHNAAIKETARLTNKRIELDESCKEILNEKLMHVIEKIDEQPEVLVTYFVPDGKKEGGSYVTAEGTVKKFQGYEGRLVMQDGTVILVNDIIEIEEI